MKPKQPIEIGELIGQAKSGDPDALGCLFDVYQSYVRLVARIEFDLRLAPKIAPSDIAQETFLQAKRSFPHFLGSTEGELIAWLRSILASQLAANVRRYQAQRRDIRLEQHAKHSIDQSAAKLEYLFADRGRTPSESAIRRERSVILADALAKLSEEYREIIVMRHLQGQSFSDIAELGDRTIDSVKGVWRRALAKLKVIIDEESI
ncbi:MAG: sigma-70 family RNA polymerase sigma factor [Planctomycetales bacterium]|nr:sigma-70 family RNA polymerase sigma factor [Planctomycetales bacterium]